MFVVLGAPALAQAPYPSQRVNMYIGFAAGGFADTIARVVGARLAERLGQSFIAQNLEGGGSVRATRQLTVAAPDGYTLLVTTTSIAINETLVPGRGYRAEQLEPVAIGVSGPEILTSNKQSGLRTIADVAEAARAGKVFLGTPGIGSGSHIAAEYFFKNLVKARVQHIPFAGGNPAMLGLLAGDVNVLATTASGNTTRTVMNGDAIGIGVEAKQRTHLLPQVPTFAEAGYAGFEASSWTGFFAPAGTPAAVVEKLNTQINAILREPETKARIDAMGLEVTQRDVAATKTFFTEEIANWGRMVAAAGITQ
jgi:tripartite-type tricarboxylate transporter receptor subunit TctC